EKHLTLQIRHLDEIAIDDHEAPDAGPREHVRDDGAERSAAEHDRGRFGEAPLAVFAEAGQQHLAVIAGEISAHRRSMVAGIEKARARCGLALVRRSATSRFDIGTAGGRRLPRVLVPYGPCNGPRSDVKLGAR